MQTKHQKRRIRVAAQISSVVFASRIYFVHEMRRRTIRELDVEHFLHIFLPNLIYSPFTRMSRFSVVFVSQNDDYCRTFPQDRLSSIAFDAPNLSVTISRSFARDVRKSCRGIFIRFFG